MRQAIEAMGVAQATKRLSPIPCPMVGSTVGGMGSPSFKSCVAALLCVRGRGIEHWV